ncbi:hypothetical protein [Vibrio nigripulchritudo]|uniref:hypothetical protein n=1 Tax=Vibrio nigripulchritudo TaxID=28173 RepID=UPI00137929B6|nr:hypothetical protein [Vibrio nigripulchritudo]
MRVFRQPGSGARVHFNQLVGGVKERRVIAQVHIDAHGFFVYRAKLIFRNVPGPGEHV